MNQQEFVRGARVLGNDGDEIGVLDDIDETSEPPSLVVRLQSDDRSVRIPYHQVDHQQSSDREIVTMIPGAELLHSHTVTHEASAEGAEAVREEAARGTETGDHLTISLSEEHLSAHTRDVERGRVVIHKRVETVPHEESIEVAHDEVDVERVEVNRDLDEPPVVRHEGDTMIVPVVEEVLVVEKRLRLVEELRVTRRRVSETTTIREDLRREVVDVSADPELGNEPEG